MYPRIHIAGHEYSTYWMVFLIGVILMFLTNILRGRKKGRSAGGSAVLTAVVILLSLLGAKILYYLENIHVLLERGVSLDGVSFFGSVFLVPAGMYLYCLAMKENYRRVMDFLSPSLMLMLGVLRIGCFVNGCCGGISVILAGFHISKYPTQLTECVCDLLIMAGLLLYEKFWEKEGRLYPFIMVYYGCVRFVIEFARDTAKDWLHFSHGQWFALISVVIGGYLLARMGKEDKKTARRRTRR